MAEDGGHKTPGLLRGWRAIAAHFGSAQSTVRRWTATRDMPIHHAAGEKGAAVYAYVHELDAWLTRQRDLRASAGGAVIEIAPPQAVPEPRSARPDRATRRRLLWGVPAAALVATGAGLWFFGGGALLEDADPADPVPPAAREHYLRATFLLNRRTANGIRDAIPRFTRAIEIAPEYAEAHAGLAMAYNLGPLYAGMDARETAPLAEDAARRALGLAPSLDLAQVAMAFNEFLWRWNAAAGLERFEHALRINPDSADTLMWYGGALLLAGRPEEALPVLNRSQALDPRDSTNLNLKAQALFFTGEIEDAFDVLAALTAADPTYPLAQSTRYGFAVALEDYDTYLDSYALYGDLIGRPGYRQAAQAGSMALARDGAVAMARAMFEVEHRHFQLGEGRAWNLARHQAIMGDTEETFRWLRVSHANRDEMLIGINTDPTFRTIENHPDYARLLADIGFPATV